eukprot:4446156-Pyramimonas_sp.AAC.1
MRKNQYEESLFRCEDDRFELDMVIETNESCFKVRICRPLELPISSLPPPSPGSRSETLTGLTLAVPHCTPVHHTGLGLVQGTRTLHTELAPGNRALGWAHTESIDPIKHAYDCPTGAAAADGQAGGDDPRGEGVVPAAGGGVHGRPSAVRGAHLRRARARHPRAHAQEPGGGHPSGDAAAPPEGRRVAQGARPPGPPDPPTAGVQAPRVLGLGLGTSALGAVACGLWLQCREDMNKVWAE